VYVVEAVGIEPVSVCGDSPDSDAIAGKGALGETLVDPSEPKLEDYLRTRVPSIDALYGYPWLRDIWGALRVV